MQALECAECGCFSDEAAVGWRAYLAGGLDDEGDTALETVSFCPKCAEHEFGCSGT